MSGQTEGDHESGSYSSENPSTMSISHQDSPTADEVASWLDSNPTFLYQYLRSRGLTNWSSNFTNSPTISPTSSKRFHDQCSIEEERVPCDEAIDASGIIMKTATLKRQQRHKSDLTLQKQDSLSPFLQANSGSDTPVRKISARDFDAVGSRPILNTSSDGSLTFISTSLRTTPVNTSMSGTNRSKLRRRSEIRTLDEREFMAEIILDICKDLDITSLCYKILRNVSLLLDADRCSLFLLEEDRATGKKVLVSRLFDVTADSTLEQCLEKSAGDKPLTVPLGVGIMGTVAQTGQYLNIEDAYKDSRFSPEIDHLTGYVTRSILCMPLKDSNDEVMGVAQAVNKVLDIGKPFTDRDLVVFESYLAFCGIGLKNAQVYRQSNLETLRNQVLLDLARLIFEEQSDLGKLIMRIMMHTQSLLQCDVCQVLLIDDTTNSQESKSGSNGSFMSKKSNNLGMFGCVYELCYKDFIEEPKTNSTEPRFPVNLGITEFVARTGETVNIKDAYLDDRFDKSVDTNSGRRTKAILCMPIKNSQRQIVGVCQLVNKMDDSWFTQADQNLFEAFALFSGLGIHNAQMYDRAVRAVAKQRVALEVLSYHAIAPREEAIRLKKTLVPSVRYFKLGDFTFTDFNLSDEDTLRASLRMFIDLDLLNRFHISYTVFCRWLLSVKKNYRNVTYHNWRHAFNVSQTMFAIMKNANVHSKLGPIQSLGLLIACLCHDLDHRGTNNQFQIKTMSPLADLYSTSVLEHHHFDQCMMILTTKGSDILSNVTTEEYSQVIHMVENAILSTDLARYFHKRTAIFNLLGIHDLSSNEMTSLPPQLDHHKSFYRQVSDCVVEERIDWSNILHVELVCSMLMTACDVAAITKPWEVQRKIAELVASEFFEQGDIEKSQLNITPQDTMDRDKKDELPRMQVDFIDVICLPVYQALVRISPDLIPLLEGCIENRKRWKLLSERRNHNG